MGERLAVFDLDGTLLIGSKTVMPILAAHLWQEGFRRPAGVGRFALAGLAGVARKLRLISRERYTEYGSRLILSWMKGRSVEEMKPYFVATAKQLLTRVRATTLAEIKERQAQGYRTVILSATLQPFLAEIAAQVGCDAVGSPVALDHAGRITGDLGGPYCTGPAKLEALHAWARHWPEIDWQGSFAYADTLPDLTVLEAVGIPVAVAPEEPLRQVAVHRGWRIIES